MAIPPEFLEELRRRLSLSGVVGRRVRLVKAGREWKGLCPFHVEKTPSFWVNDDKAFYKCFGCGRHGDVVSFVIDTEGLTFPEAVERLAEQAGMPVPTSRPEDRERADRDKGLAAAAEAAAAWFERQLREPRAAPARDYLAGRGLDAAAIQRFRLGYAPDGRTALKAALMGQGFAEAQLVEAGLLIRVDDQPTYDRFRNRIIFPIADRRGRVIAFGGRALGDVQPKYLNSPEGPLFHKGRTLYAHHLAREAAAAGQPVILVEGYMDAIALHRAGFGGAVAPLGTALTEEQLGELWRMAPEPVVCFDGDKAGQAAAARAAERALPHLAPGRSLRFLALPAGQDPDDLMRAPGGAEGFRTLLQAAVPLVEQLWQARVRTAPTDTPEARAKLRQDLDELVARIDDKRVRDEYAGELKQRWWNFQAAAKVRGSVTRFAERALFERLPIRPDHALRLKRLRFGPLPLPTKATPAVPDAASAQPCSTLDCIIFFRCLFKFPQLIEQQHGELQAVVLASEAWNAVIDRMLIHDPDDWTSEAELRAFLEAGGLGPAVEQIAAFRLTPRFEKDLAELSVVEAERRVRGFLRGFLLQTIRSDIGDAQQLALKTASAADWTYLRGLQASLADETQDAAAFDG